MKAISPIIAIIILLLITIAISGAGYSYISTYWTGLVGKEIQVVGSFCVDNNQSRVTIKNIGTGLLNTGEITVINPLTGGNITQDVVWSGGVRVADPDLALELKFEEGSGTTATDTSGQGHNGTLNGTPDWVEGKVGGALEFDGSMDYVSLGTWFDYQAFTIAFWANPGSMQNQYADIIDNNHDGDSNWVLQQDNANTNVYMFGGHAFNLTGDAWHHLSIVREGTTCYFYMDGALNGSGACWASGINYDSSPFRNLDLGRHHTFGRYWSGYLDELIIYKRALPPGEIRMLAENFPARPGDTALIQPGETATLTNTCMGMCRYNLILGSMAKETMLEC